MRILSAHDFTLMAACLVPAVLLAWGLIAIAASSARDARRHGVTEEQFVGAAHHVPQIEVAALSERTSGEESELAVVTT